MHINQKHFKSSQKLLKYFNGTVILTSFVLPAAEVFPVNFNLKLNDALLPGKLTILPIII